MDLRIYYQKIRDEQQKIAEPFPVVVSLETQDGGRAGVQTEVPNAVAARMIVDGLARVATAEESTTFREAQLLAKLHADEEAEASKVEFTVVPKRG